MPWPRSWRCTRTRKDEPAGGRSHGRAPLAHLFEPHAAGATRSAAYAAIRAGETTPDLGGALSTAAVGDRVCDHMGT